MGVILMYLGIDLGTTGLKCVMFEDDGAVAAEYNEEYPLIFVGSFVEQDAEVWWSNVVTAVRSLVEKTGRRDVKALTVSSQSIEGSTGAGGIPKIRCDSNGVKKPQIAPSSGPTAKPAISTGICIGNTTEPAFGIMWKA